MNKTAIKAFAIEARKKLIASVKDKAGLLGIREEGCSEPEQKGDGFEVYRTHADTENKIFDREIKQRQSLKNRIEKKGYENVMEEVAYTWFNRIIAIRFMEVNDYLPTRVRVLSSETKNKIEPDIVTQAPDVDLDFTDSEKEKVYTLKAENRLDELLSMLFIKQCNKLGEILPKIFEKVSDYTELLLNVSYTNQDGVIRSLIDNIDEDDFKEAVEIIGWMYQYYNTELNELVYDGSMEKSRIPKQLLPAATTIYTPDWAIRYMVENSLGRLWIEGHPNVDLKVGWKYYLDEAEQEADIQIQLETIREEYKAIKPEDIKFIDPCMGSGHILVYAFEVLMEIYESCGYNQRDAAKSIIKNNLYGLDIDNRAYQLAYFAVMMKARQYNRRIFNNETKCNVYSIEESNGINRAQLKYFGGDMSDIEKNSAVIQMQYLLDTMHDAKEYGSILNINQLDWELLYRFVGSLNVNGQMTLDSIGLEDMQAQLGQIVEIAEVMAQKYDVVVTNPPYLSSSRMSPKANDYIVENYPDTKSDFSTVMFERAFTGFSKHNGFISFITTTSWMFLKSFEKLRRRILDTLEFINLVDFGTELFEGKVGHNPIVAWVNRNNEPIGQMTAVRLVDYCYSRREEKHTEFFNKENWHYSNQENYSKIPGMPIAYWVSNTVICAYDNGEVLGQIAFPKTGMTTGDNNRFLRLWSEVNISSSILNATSASEAKESGKKWFPYCKGGGYKRWYGYNEYLVNWENDGFEIKNNVKANGLKAASVRSESLYFKKLITWSAVTSGKFSCRICNGGALFDSGGSSISIKKNIFYILGLLNGKIGQYYLDISNATINYQPGDIAGIPVLLEDSEQIEAVVRQNIVLSKNDWDSFETSWDFKEHPFFTYRPIESFLMRTYYQNDEGHMVDTELVMDKNKIESCYTAWDRETTKNFEQLKSNEEELNRIFIEIYGLQDELIPEVEDKDVTIRKADLGRDIRSFICYAVGCMFGRYSLDVEGLAYAGGSWEEVVNSGKYKTFIPDHDNVIPITDEEYFEDDIVGLFVKFVKTVYGEDTLEENLDFIAKALGNKGVSSRDIIRNYFVKDFYKDHLKVYQKRPIYWQFDSGKENGFKALIYMHRYDKDTVGRVRADYLHKTQAAIENAIKGSDYIIETTSNNVEKSKATKAREKYIKQLGETRVYDEAMAHIAHKRIDIDLDDGVKVNYAKFQGIEVSNEGKKTQKINLLTKI